MRRDVEDVRAQVCAVPTETCVLITTLPNLAEMLITYTARLGKFAVPLLPKLPPTIRKLQAQIPKNTLSTPTLCSVATRCCLRPLVAMVTLRLQPTGLFL